VSAVVVSQSRIWLGSALVAAAIVVWIGKDRKKLARRVAVVVVAGALLAIPATYRHASLETAPPPASSSPSASSAPTSSSTATPPQIAPPIDSGPVVGIVRRLSLDALRDSIDIRLGIWEPLLAMGLERPILGYGKGAIGAIPGLGAGEAHSSYLRTFVESGVLGLLAFVLVLAILLRLAWTGVRTGSGSILARRWCLALSLAMIGCAFVQDAFTPVIVAEMFWLSAALAVAEHASERDA
jgi:O-antigen ligase